MASRTAPGEARQLIAEWELPPTAEETAQLLISELVTNSLAAYERAHIAGGCISIDIEMISGVVRVGVVDSAPGWPQKRRASLADESGRGLRLVTAMAATYGCHSIGIGKRVWFTIPLTAPEPDPDLSLWRDL